MAEQEGFTQRPTGIEELDNILNGGIPRGHVVLLAGDSGTGKTLLGLEWLFRGCTEHGENGLYITLTESITQAAANIRNMEFYSEDAFNDGVHFTDFRSTLSLLGVEEGTVGRDEVDEVLDSIEDLVEQMDADRVVIDSITAIAYMLESRQLIRHFIFRLGTLLDSLDVTAFMTSEVSGEGHSVYGVEEFISDGIITLRQKPLHDNLLRQLQVVKMRGMDYYSKMMDFTITDAGINISVVDVPLEYDATDRRISFGVSGLDTMCDGGVFEGSVTLLSGPAGAGKTLASMHFLKEALEEGENALYVGFEESREQVLHNARHFGMSLEDYVEKGNLQMRTVYAEDSFPHEHLADIKRIVEEHDISRVAIDPITSVGNIYPEEEHFDFTKRLIGYIKHRGASTMITASSRRLMGAERLAEEQISTLADNVLMLQYTEARGLLERVINILKTRGTNHDKRIRTYDIDGSGMHIQEAVSAFEGVLSGSARKVEETVKEQLEDLFKEFLGPMGEKEFRQFAKGDVSQHAFEEYAEDLEEKNVLTSEQAEDFRKAASRIFRSNGQEGTEGGGL